ncbi:annexin A1-like [Kryptolebias marmoratus]|uniref:Annexin n=1 Tax=Kryptolebias marmoratus TaxID=37003 RepID=A0A3Q3A733_KRYMA|nr:annexin A1-like [Kryptolebias marmoratus]XP_017294034.1 annexin A1-like [Kryptolebias marmoratus]
MAFFKKFFKNIVHDKDKDKDKDDLVTVKGKPKPKYYGTVTPYPNFNASSDASILQSAIESKNVDEDVIVAVLVKRSNEQRQMIKAVYEASTGKNLVKSLKSVLRSDLEDVALALLMTPAHFDAHLLRKATKRLGTDEEVLVEVLATRSNKEIEEIKKVFKQEYGVELEQVIKDETSGDFTKALLALLSAKKDESTEVDMEQAKKDAKVLFESGEGVGRANVSSFIEILTTRSGPQLSKTFQHYATMSDITLPKALQMELKGDIEDCLIAIVKCAWNTPAFFAEKLHESMKGHGTRDKMLIRVLVSRSEVDLKKVVENYRAMFERTLQEDILADTKGHYQKVLLGLCGPH